MISSPWNSGEEGWMASQAVVTGLEAPTEDERTMAMLAHLLMAFTGFIGPLVIFCVKENSRFGRFHSLQGLIWHAIYLGLSFVFMAGFFSVVNTSLFNLPPAAQCQRPPVVFFFFSLFFVG